MSEEMAREVSELKAVVGSMAEQNSRDHERVRDTLKELGDKIDMATRSSIESNAFMSQIRGTSADHETRVRSLERWRFGLVGAMAAIGAFGAYFVDLIKDRIAGS
ncbi:MAG: hypothetical protein RLN89_08495 [Parvibaculum sp.]